MFLEGAGASGRLSSSIETMDDDVGEPQSCRTADTKTALSADASTETRLAWRYLNRNSFFTFRRFNRSENQMITCNPGICKDYNSESFKKFLDMC